MNQQTKLSTLLHDGLMRASNTTGNVSFNLADYLIKNKVVVLPCEVGDKFYVAYEFMYIEEHECCGFSIHGEDIELIDEVDNRYVDCNDAYYKIFFSEEDAKNELKKRTATE